MVVDGDAGSFDADLNGDFAGESVATLSFNRKHLGAACATFGDGELRQYVGESLDPQIFVRSDDVEESTLIVVMPMRGI